MRLVVLDTNVLDSAFRSRRGASFRLLEQVGTGRFDIAISVPPVLEYEYALRRAAAELGISESVAVDVVDYLCHAGKRQDIFFLWRPLLSDPRDDMVLEVAVGSASDAIITFNLHDFRQASTFNVESLPPLPFLTSQGLL